jgi:acetyl esterase/lipase
MSEAFDALRRLTAPWLERPLLSLPVPLTVHRRAFEIGARLRVPPQGPRVTWREVGGRQVRICTPEAASGRMLWLHGGGFVMGSPQSYAPLTDRLAQGTRLETWVPDYRLAPDHPFPAAPDDCLAVARSMPSPFHLGGDSAGGTLALVILQTLLAEGHPPLSLTLISPGTDLRTDREMPAHQEMVFSESVLRRFQAAYVGEADAEDPRVSPIFGEYSGAPPTLIELSSGEFLEAEGRSLAERMLAQGVRVDIHAEPGVPHDYHIFAGTSAAADRAVARIAAHVGAVA